MTWSTTNARAPAAGSRCGAGRRCSGRRGATTCGIWTCRCAAAHQGRDGTRPGVDGGREQGAATGVGASVPESHGGGAAAKFRSAAPPQPPRPIRRFPLSTFPVPYLSSRTRRHRRSHRGAPLTRGNARRPLSLTSAATSLNGPSSPRPTFDPSFRPCRRDGVIGDVTGIWRAGAVGGGGSGRWTRVF